MPWTPPETCPVCGTRGRQAPRARSTGAARTSRAPRRSRSASSTSRAARRWTSRASATCWSTSCVERGLVKDFADLYALRFEDLAALFAPKAKKGESLGARNLLEAIEASKSRELRRLVFGLGIRFVGERAAHAAGAALPEPAARSARRRSRRSTTSTRSARPWRARSTPGSATPRTSSSCARLEAAGVRVEEAGQEPASLAFQGQQFVLTGTLESMTRDEAKAAIEARGRPRDGQRVEEDHCRRRGTRRGLEARARARAGRAGDRRGRASQAARRLTVILIP